MSSFLTQPDRLALMMTVDWFNPYDRGTYSLGAVFLVVLNLPRELRNKRENMILVCLLPGGIEGNHDLAILLKPMVDELQYLQRGVNMISADGKTVSVRAMLLLVSCDLPAGRKACGFRSQTCCCTKCKFKFRHEDSKRPKKSGSGTVWEWFCDGHDYQNWTARSGEEVRSRSMEYRDCTSVKAQTDFDTQYSANWTTSTPSPC